MSWTGVDWVADFPRFLMSLSGTGRADIVGCGLTGLWVAPNDGHGGFLPPVPVLNDLAYNQSWRSDRHVRAPGIFARAKRPVLDAVERTAAPGDERRADSQAAASSGGDTPASGPSSRLGRTPDSILQQKLQGLTGFGDHGVWTTVASGPTAFSPLTEMLTELCYDHGWRLPDHPRLVADLTGDGYSDLVGFGRDGVWTALCNPAQEGVPAFSPARLVLPNFGVDQGWRPGEHVRVIADLTGDGRGDIIGFGDTGVWTSLSLGDGSFAEAAFAVQNFGSDQGWHADRHLRLACDLNGNGRADLIGFGDAGVWTSIGSDGGFVEPRFALANFAADQGWRIGQHLRLVADLTGDGRADVLGFGNDGVWTSLGDGNGGFAEPRFVLREFGFNQGWRVGLHPRMLADLTGDGRLDIVGFGDDGVWVARGNGDGSFAEPQFVLADFGLKSGRTGIEHVFVCMMENRSYDHFLGYAAISGRDAYDGKPTLADGLTGAEVNMVGAQSYAVGPGATDRIIKGPPHNFNDFMVSLCGPARNGFNPNGGAYPLVRGDGYAAAYARAADADHPGAVMQCFAPANLPIATALAREFAICDRWFGSLPGPTEPNRMFVHAANSDTWDDSPSPGDQFVAEVLGFDISFDHGTIFDRLRQANINFRIYAGDDFPNVAILHGVSLYDDIDDMDDFAGDLRDGYDAAYTFIEPSYAVVNPFSDAFYDGASQHPPGSVEAGEAFLKRVYETIRSSPVWNKSLLIVTWDEGGGFYDHVLPPRAVPTGKVGSRHGFVFDQLGTRIPAICISPLIPRNTVEHRTLEHSAVPATIEQLFGLAPMTKRDADIVGLQSLAILKAPRSDAPATLPHTVVANSGPSPALGLAAISPDTLISDLPEENLISYLNIAVRHHLAAYPDQKEAIRARAAMVKTVGEYRQYMAEVAVIARQRRAEARRSRQRVRDSINRHSH